MEQEESSSLWDRISEEYSGFSIPETNFDDSWSQEPKKYEFAPDNIFSKKPDALETGKQMLKRGDVTTAILAFEAAIQQDKQNVEIWNLLGKCHAELNNDDAAVLAYEEATTICPENLEALLNLALSYLNNLHTTKATENMKAWLTHHPVYKKVVKSTAGEQIEAAVATTTSAYDNRDELAKLLNEAMELNSEDPDLHTVFGMLYNITREMDKAVQSFQIATKYRPDDYSLWNKLGATLCNCNRAEEAMEALNKALEIKPNFVKAIVNMGNTYSNQRNHGEAVKYYLKAASMNSSSEVWRYLSFTLMQLGRPDLVEFSNNHDLAAFREHFTF